MVSIIKQTFEERKKMYMKSTLEEQLSMIQERTKHKELHTKEALASVLAYWEQFWSPEACVDEST